MNPDPNSIRILAVDEEADLRAKMKRVAGYPEQRLRTGVKQQVEDHLLVLQGQRCQFTRL